MAEKLNFLHRGRKIGLKASVMLFPKLKPKPKHPKGRIFNMKRRSVGHQCPPLPSQHKIKFAIPKNMNGRAFGIFSASSHGNLPSNWSCSPQSPPVSVKMLSGLGECRG